MSELIERLKEVSKMIGSMCSERRPPKMSIPALPNHDEDLVICETIRLAIEHIEKLENIEARVQKWCVDCFGETTAADVTERTWRFLEEALEFVQSLDGSKEDVLKMLDYTFGRPKGEPEQELGGVMVTLAALTGSRGMNINAAFEQEFARINQPAMIEKIRAKHATKPHKSPLPGDYNYAVRKAQNESEA